MKTLLAIADPKDWDSYLKFYRNKRLLKGFKFKHISYESILEDKFPKINTERILVFCFFPFKYWDINIETKKDKATYGNKTYYTKFDRFWKIIKNKIQNQYKKHKICYVNNPKFLALDRDKELTKKLLARSKIKVSNAYKTRDYNTIQRLLKQGKKFFIKVRFGSMGKGITYLKKGSCLTNFRFKDTIQSRKSDYGWTFKKINDPHFIKQLLKKDIIIEDAIDPYIIRKRKFDLRVYVCYGNVIYIYPRSTNINNVTTNISQGAKGEPQRYLRKIPKNILKKARIAAIRSAKALRINFCGVDIMPDSKGDVFVIEVNAFPGFPKAKSFNLSRQIIRRLKCR